MQNQWHSHSSETSGIDLRSSPTTIFGRLIRSELYLLMNFFKDTGLLFLCALSENLPPTPQNFFLVNNVEFPQEINGVSFHKVFQNKSKNKNGAYILNRENIERLNEVYEEFFHHLFWCFYSDDCSEN